MQLEKVAKDAIPSVFRDQMLHLEHFNKEVALFHFACIHTRLLTQASAAECRSDEGGSAGIILFLLEKWTSLTFDLLGYTFPARIDTAQHGSSGAARRGHGEQGAQFDSTYDSNLGL